MSYSIDNKYNTDVLSFFFSVLCGISVWCFYADNSAIVFCAGHEIPVETIAENTPTALSEPEKHGSFWSYKKVGLVLFGILCTVAFFKSGGGGSGGGIDGSELLSAVGQAALVEDIVPAVAAVAAATATAPAINIIVDTGPSVFALRPIHHQAITVALGSLEMSGELRELVVAGSENYFSNFMDSLQSSYVREVLVDFFTEDSMSPIHEIFEQIQEKLRSPDFDIGELLIEYSRVMDLNLMGLIRDIGNASFGRLLFASSEDFYLIMYVLGFVGLKLLQDVTLILSLVQGRGYEVLSSSVIEHLEWSNVVHLMENSTTSDEGISTFSNLLQGNPVNGNVDDFIASNIEAFKTTLQSRDQMGSTIILKDGYILVMLLKDILKGYIDRGIHEWFLE